MLSAGIVGLPNVGKSTLFNAITNSQVEAANYPFATIDPNVGIVNVRDPRLLALAELIQPDKLVFSTFQFVDIAGLVKGASQGEGLGNKFLANIREVDCICHVIRCFNDSSITHVNNVVDPIADLEIVNTELIIADLDVITNRIARISKKAQSGDKLSQKELELCIRIKEALNEGEFASSVTESTEDQILVKSYNLLTSKPFIYVANIAESEISEPEKSELFIKLKSHLNQKKATIIAISAKIESELAKANSAEERKEMMDLLGMGSISGLDKIIKSAYDILGLWTYFTFGKKETRAWAFLKGKKAPECAGIIHTDFERGFIKAEVMRVEDLLHYKTELKVKEAGKLRLEGKDYEMQDGDVCNFRFNV
ncbi:redox-regulated ATPase YchF [[Mycoplasma] testudinis]|uniref:redox-regulated ATPase YchF n=1 Tax=[Mycoplasma] testudinis TaxID=33924 RepID=UPI000481BCA2|nr:redox-regulated ATPase YchF [[Mycoplasma] testudinis]